LRVDQECLDLEKLGFMRPDKAAIMVEQIFSPTFGSLSVKWDEIRDNIQKSGNGTVGSGYGELALNFLIEKGEKGVDVNAKTKQGNTALHLALHSRHEVVVRLLMENGADIEATDASGRTPLISSVKSGIDQIVALLLEMRANTEAKDSGGETALIVAAKVGSKVMVQKLLDGGADSERNYRQGRTPRDVAAQRGFLEVAELLHTAGNRKKT
jgi:ankyrin repeat protein